MNKRELRQVISEQFQPGMTVQVTLRDLSGDFEVVGKRCGRGKGGSWLADLRHVASGTEVTIGTPASDNVLNVTVGDTFYGLQNFEDLPPTYDTDVSRAVTYKEQFRSLLDGGSTVRVGSVRAPEINGTFRVTGGRQLRGRGGQIVLALENVSNGERADLWSYRHSGVIDTFEVV